MSEEANKNARNATRGDANWRNAENSAPRNATRGDANWRNAENSTPRNATRGDANWRSSESSTSRGATKGDRNWRKAMNEMLGPADVISGATVNTFVNPDDLKAAIAKLEKLESMEHHTYTVKKTISLAGGESVVLLCSDSNGNDVAAKVYREPFSKGNTSIEARLCVLDYMATEEGKKYTLAVSDIGLVEIQGGKYYFEIMPYCSEGDLSTAKDFSFEEIVQITKRLNEAIHSMHMAGILHRDIKPSNLFRLNGEIVLGDFGVAKILNSGETGKTPGTEGYQAPETLLSVSAEEPTFYFNDKTDYYSLGATLGTLYQGKYIYEGMSRAVMTICIQRGELPITKVCPNREFMDNLLRGLCRFDPNSRFGYEDVKKWLSNHDYTGGIGEEWTKKIEMSTTGEVFQDAKSLFFGLAKDKDHWDEGKKMLYRRHLEPILAQNNSALAGAARDAEERYIDNDTDMGLFVFLKAIYAPGPITWKGRIFNGLNELGNAMLSENNCVYYGELLQKKIVSYWLLKTEGLEVATKTKKLVEEIEQYAVDNPEIACYWFGNVFATEKKVVVCNKTAKTLEELINAMFASPSDFYQIDGYDKLIDKKLGAELYGFLYSYGYQELIDKEWKNIQGSSEVNRFTYLFAMLENIAVKEKCSSKKVQEFFIDYGPVGIANYTKQLVCRTDNKVYEALDMDGRNILSKIESFKAPTGDNIAALFKGYTVLMDQVENLRKVLIDNPYCIVTGVYDNKGIICTNLVGCFAFKIFDCMAPLGFCTLLEKGGK